MKETYLKLPADITTCTHARVLSFAVTSNGVYFDGELGTYKRKKWAPEPMVRTLRIRVEGGQADEFIGFCEDKGRPKDKDPADVSLADFWAWVKKNWDDIVAA